MAGAPAGPPSGVRLSDRISLGVIEAALLGMLRNGNHLTLARCRDRLAAETGVRVHPWTAGRALRRVGWT